MKDWSSLEDAYGPAGDIPQLLEAFLLSPNAMAEAELSGRLVHQGWRFSASLAALEVLADAARSRPASLDASLELIIQLGIGDLVGYFPDIVARCAESAAVQLAGETCVPQSIAVSAWHMLASLNDTVAGLARVKCEAMLPARELFFLYCFDRDLSRFRQLLGISATACGQEAAFAAICLSSLDGARVEVDVGDSIVLHCHYGDVHISHRVTSVEELEGVGVLFGEWELALLPGCIKAGDASLRNLGRLVDRLDSWRSDFFRLCLQRMNGRPII